MEEGISAMRWAMGREAEREGTVGGTEGHGVLLRVPLVSVIDLSGTGPSICEKAKIPDGLLIRRRIMRLLRVPQTYYRACRPAIPAVHFLRLSHQPFAR